MLWSGSGVDRGRVAQTAAMLCSAALALLIVWLLVRLLWLLMASPADYLGSAPRTDNRLGSGAPKVSIAKWHLFGNSSANATAAMAASASNLRLSLRGTLADADPHSGVAVIVDEQGQQQAWRVGEEILAGVRLSGVYADHATLTHDGREETLSLERGEPGGAAVAPLGAEQRRPRGASAGNPSEAAVTPLFTPPALAHGAQDWQQTIDKIRANPADLAQRVQIIPVIRDGAIAGVRLSSGSDAALLAQAGLRADDVVTAVNGVAVDSVASGQQIVQNLSHAQSVRVSVLRDGQTIELNVSLR